MLNESERKRSFRHCFLLFLCEGLFSISLVRPILFPLSLSLLPYDALLITWGREGKPKKVPTGERKRKRRRRGRISPPELFSPHPRNTFLLSSSSPRAGDAAAALINTGREEKASGFFMGWGEDNKTWREVDRWRW